MISNYVTRKITKNNQKTIIPPTPEEILDDNFNYPDYVEHILNLKVDYNFLEEFFDNGKEDCTSVDPQIYTAFENFENSIIEIQKQYEEDIQSGTPTLDYNQAMKNVAQAYFDKLRAIITFNLQKEKELQALTAKRSELVAILNRVVNIKSNIEKGAEARLTAFVNREIPLGKLYIYDLTRMQNSEIYSRHRQALERYRRKVFSGLLDDDGAEYKPIEELHFKRKK